MKIAFLWHFDKARLILPNWRDGHRKVIEELGLVHEVKWFLGDECHNVPDEYEFILIWTDPMDNLVHNYTISRARKGLMLTTDNYLAKCINNLVPYDVIYCESNVVKDQVRSMGLRAIKAIGTDTDFYIPDPKVKKDIPFFFPGTFSPWKKQSSIAYLGKKLYCIGTIQPDGQGEYDACVNAGVHVEVGYFEPEKIREYYNRAENVIIPSVHGSERTVLEAMAMNIQPIILSKQNAKSQSYLLEYLESDYKSPRDFILNNYSHEQYLKAILKGIEK